MGRGGHGDDEGTPYDQTLDELDFLRSACAAAQRGQLDKLQALLSRRGAAAALGGGAVGGRGYTPLHYAAREGHLECARVLLDAGACAENALLRLRARGLHTAELPAPQAPRSTRAPQQAAPRRCIARPSPATLTWWRSCAWFPPAGSVRGARPLTRAPPRAPGCATARTRRCRTATAKPRCTKQRRRRAALPAATHLSPAEALRNISQGHAAATRALLTAYPAAAALRDRHGETPSECATGDAAALLSCARTPE